MKIYAEKKYENRRVYLAVISSVALSCGGTALAQTNNVADVNGVSPGVSTNVVSSGSSTNVTQLGNVTVVGKLNQARNQIVPDLGATAFTINKDQIATLSQGGNAPMNQVVLRAPGVAEDSAANGDLHVRGEHANLQYRINDVLLPEGITGFGLELDPRFVESMQLITGSLPAQYGFRTAGVVDIQTKSGAFENGGEAGVYGGSYDTVRPSFEYGGAQGKWDYFVDGSYDHNDLGIENPTPSHDAIHDQTDQYKAFVYASRILSDTSRISLMGSASYSDFQVPNTPGLPAGTAPGGDPWQSGTFDSSTLNENQNEQNYYGVATYQKSAGDLNFQASVFGRNSSVHFTPDPTGDLFFNGVASDVNRKLYSGGLQADASYNLGDKHTIRAGVMLLDEYLSADSTTTAILDGQRRSKQISIRCPVRRRRPSFRTAFRARCSPVCICRMNGKSCPRSRSITARALTSIIPPLTRRTSPVRAPISSITPRTRRRCTPVTRVTSRRRRWKTCRREMWRHSMARPTNPQPVPTRRTIPSRPNGQIISTPASARNWRPACKSAWMAITSTP